MQVGQRVQGAGSAEDTRVHGSVARGAGLLSAGRSASAGLRDAGSAGVQRAQGCKAQKCKGCRAKGCKKCRSSVGAESAGYRGAGVQGS